MPISANLPSLLSSVTLTPVSNLTCYRSVDLVVLANHGVHVLDGAHSRQTGGRFNSPNSEPICYLAGSMTLASFEVEQDALALGLMSARPNPRVVLAVVVDAMILDLTNPVILAHLGLVQADIMQPSHVWRTLNAGGQLAPAQLIGDAARQRSDMDGIRYPSWLNSCGLGNILPSPATANVALFMDRNRPDCPRNANVAVSIVDPSGLLGP
jgi:RES domain-containing protein